MAHRLLLAVTAAAGALLLAVSAWVVLAGDDAVLVDRFLPVAADPFLATTPSPPATPNAAAVDPVAPDLDPASGRDPFLPLVAPPATPVVGTGGTTPYPTVTPTVTPTPLPTPAPSTTPTPTPAGKKKQVPTTGPVL
jgi:hypothetical protein